MKLLLLAMLFWQQPPSTATGTISGAVFYADGTPVGSRLILLTPFPEAGQPQSTTRPIMASTGADGTFRQSVPPGRYLMQTSGQNSVFYPGVLNQSLATPLVVAPGSVNSGVNLSLPPAASGVRIQGRVRLPERYPQLPSELQVRLERSSSSSRLLSSDGTFEFAHVMPGAYPLTVSAPGTVAVMVTVADRDIAGIEVVAPPLIPVQGTVNLEGTGTRPRLLLQLEGLLPPGSSPATVPGGPFRTTVNPLTDGSFSKLLPPGEYRVTVMNLEAGYYLKGLFSGTTDIGNLLKVAATDTAVKIGVTAGISSGVRMAGRITRPGNNNSPFPETVMLAGVAVGDTAEAAIHSDGTFEFPRILPGNYLARVALTASVSSAPVSVVVPNRSVTDFEIAVPAPRLISGKIAVDGNGPPPKFPLLFVQGASLVSEAWRPGEPANVPIAALVNTVLTGKAGIHLLQADINALPDGSFKLEIPDGEYQVSVLPSVGMGISGMPAAYFLRSLTANSADLLTEPLRISEEQTPEIHIGLGTTAPNPWVKVSGSVKGLDSAGGVGRVALESSVTSTIEAYLDSEGKFEFPAVLQRNRYVARLLPADDSASTPRINIEDKDVADVEIVVPPKREITARITVEGNYPVPSVGLTLDAKDSSMTFVIRPESDGSARIKVPEDERRIRQLSGLPLGYYVKSITYGSADLRTQPLRIGGGTTELKVTLAVNPDVPSGSLRGKVTGIESGQAPVQMVLNGITAFARFETPLNDDGSFSFAKLPQGTYALSIAGAVATTSLSPGSIIVSGVELSGMEITAVQTGNSRSVRTEELPKGATISEFPGNGRAVANESAAVANMRTINTALVTFLSVNGGRYGSLSDLIAAGLLDQSFNTTKAGFNYSLIAVGSDYAAAAIPANSATGRHGFYATADAVIRYSTFELLAPPQQSGKPVQ